ncbi:MAG: hypothetical protein IGR78_15070, partial [Fischerella thermalis M58_A2018_009]|nr:hypothetical protein [Fischerella thermalis M58_A2018_009]
LPSSTVDYHVAGISGIGSSIAIGESCYSARKSGQTVANLAIASA